MSILKKIEDQLIRERKSLEHDLEELFMDQNENAVQNTEVAAAVDVATTPNVGVTIGAPTTEAAPVVTANTEETATPVEEKKEDTTAAAEATVTTDAEVAAPAATEAAPVEEKKEDVEVGNAPEIAIVPAATETVATNAALAGEKKEDMTAATETKDQTAEVVPVAKIGPGLIYQAKNKDLYIVAEVVKTVLGKDAYLLAKVADTEEGEVYCEIGDNLRTDYLFIGNASDIVKTVVDKYIALGTDDFNGRWSCYKKTNVHHCGCTKPESHEVCISNQREQDAEEEC